ncbi:MAG: hypothetical protein CXT73_05035 [Methanobacteriota archaeon]|jgi:hypothetical protein|nr:MAG: hypothetical protein CXT73_05035 [Euryarchaeota archaeon]
MEFREPLIGTREQNYKYFYGTGCASIVSLLILLIVTGYTAYTATEINEVISDLNELLPDARDSLRIVKEMCQHENFTKSWGNIC